MTRGIHPLTHAVARRVRTFRHSATNGSSVDAAASPGCVAVWSASTSARRAGSLSYRASSSARLRSRVIFEAAASSYAEGGWRVSEAGVVPTFCASMREDRERTSLPLAACTSSVAVDMARFIVISLLFGSGCGAREHPH